ncbi:MAG: hypothetical protein U9Q07_03985 [Planctomycetota bacterium]|nr:hypothetical protein [Planctomycetota bacterium]
MTKRKQKEYTGETFEIYGKLPWINPKTFVPGCFNGEVRVEKFRVIIEKVDEPKEETQRRILELWETSDNIHTWEPLRKEAERLGLVLPQRRLAKRGGERPYWETEGENEHKS